ncbi:hypothetical protein C4579_02940 [Candidatus Microgenomates bacterium]|nr:MAG: hypothetical protein C4579_02940 [Candidatus Microgenomates bacterium]
MTISLESIQKQSGTSLDYPKSLAGTDRVVTHTINNILISNGLAASVHPIRNYALHRDGVRYAVTPPRDLTAEQILTVAYTGTIFGNVQIGRLQVIENNDEQLSMYPSSMLLVLLSQHKKNPSVEPDVLRLPQDQDTHVYFLTPEGCLEYKGALPLACFDC